MPRPEQPNSMWVDFLGAETRFVQGKRYRIRIVEAGREHPETLLLFHGGGGHIETFARNVVPLGQQLVHADQQQISGAGQLYVETGVEHVGRCHALVHEARLGPDMLRQIGQERDHVVAGFALDLVDALDLERALGAGEKAFCAGGDIAESTFKIPYTAIAQGQTGTIIIDVNARIVSSSVLYKIKVATVCRYNARCFYSFIYVL